MNIKITVDFLNANPDCIFVYGDNDIHAGYGGAAALRDLPNTLGFITKKLPTNDDSSFYTLDEYKEVYEEEIKSLQILIKVGKKVDKIFLISPLGSGLANKYNIWEKIIEPNLKKDLKQFKNIIWLY